MNTYIINKYTHSAYFYTTKALMAPISVSPEDSCWTLYQYTRSSLTGDTHLWPRRTIIPGESYVYSITIHLKFSCSAGTGPIFFAQFCSRLPEMQMLINHSEVKQLCCLQRILFYQRTQLLFFFFMYVS